jgi:hypothetical protein
VSPVGPPEIRTVDAVPAIRLLIEILWFVGSSFVDDPHSILKGVEIRVP